MDPALLNYLQQQQGNSMGQNPMQEAMPPQQAPYNPFDSGISKAISSARESLGMTDKQQEKALRRSIFAFGENIAQQPKQKGFWNNFGAGSRALAPAIMAHDDAEDAAFTQNNALANQMLAYQAAEQNRLSQEEERAWKRQHAEAQLAEQRRAHDMMNGYRQQKNQSAVSPISALGTDYIPIESKSERLMYTKDKKASGEILQELSSIKKDYDQFKELTKDDLINPMTPYGVGSATNAGKDFWGYFSGDKELREETRKRKALDAKLGKFAIELERKIKGGVLSEGMVKRFENKGLLPSLTDPQDVFEEKLNNLTEEMAGRYKASDASLRYGVHLSPIDLAQLEKNNTQVANTQEDGNQAGNTQEYIPIYNPNTGEETEIHNEDLKEATSRGWQVR